ncbi:MAG: MerR family transcriptional regulator, partial [Solirubrobacterales bacterium]|nr:MerR family transcriptional regulator [Solirubrobacterales bacterium]
MNQQLPTIDEVAERAGVSVSTLRRWVAGGLIPQLDGARGGWPPAAAAQARIVARLRERGHTIAQIRAATEDGRLAFGYVEELLPGQDGVATASEAARATGLEPALLARMWSSFGLPTGDLDSLSDED